MLDAKQKIILDGVQKGLRKVAGSTFFADYYNCIFSILQGEYFAILLYVPDSLVVDIEILGICQIGLVVFEVVEPGLEVRKHLPATFPNPPAHPPRVVLVH